MLNIVWAVLLCIGIIFGIASGKADVVGTAIIKYSTDAVQLVIGMCGIIAFWSGIMKIAEKGGITKVLDKILSPLIKPLFPNLSKDHPAYKAILMNISANFLGLGNAATPLGIKAMQELDVLNGKRDTASNEMCMFVILNTAAFQLIPTMSMALRAQAGSKTPGDIILVIWTSSVISIITALIVAFMLKKLERKEKL